MFTIKHTRPLALALAAATLASAAAIPAQAAHGQQSVAVAYDDLNLANAEGQKVLEKRLDRAARQVCGITRGSLTSRLPSRYADACYAEARAKVAQQVALLVRGERRGG